MLKPFYDMNDEYAELRKACNKVSGGLIGIRSMLRNLSTDEGFPRGSYDFFMYYHKSTGIIAKDFAEYSHRFRRVYALRKRHQNPLSDAWSLHFLASNYRDVPGTVDILDTYLKACRTGKMISECHPRELFDLTKTLRDFYIPKSSKTRSPRSPELDIHWRQLDVLAPFEIAWASGVTMRHEMMYLLDSMMRTIQDRNGLWARNSTEGLVHHVTGMKTLFRDFNSHRTELMQQYQEFMAVNWIRLQLEDKLHTLGVPDMNREKGVFTVRKPLSQSRGRFLEWAENMDTHLWASWVLTSAIRAPPEYWRKVERRLAVDNKTRANKLELDAFGIPIMGSAEIGPTEPTEDLESIAGNPQESIAENLQESAKSIRKKRASLWRLVKKSFPAILIKTKAKPGLGPDNPKLVRPKVAPVGEKPRAQTAAQHKLKETSSGKSTDPNSIRKAPGSKTIPLRAGAVSVRKNKKNHTVGQTSKPYSTVASIRSNAGHNEDGKDDVQSREYENSIKQGDEANQTPILTKKLAATPHMSSQQAPSLDPATPKFWSHRLHKGSNEKAIVVHYCKSLRNTEEVAKLFLQDEIIGFDMEWKAQASSTDGIQDNVSLIQIANKDRIALFQIALFHPARNVQDLVSPSLKRVLESPDITKVGVSIKADCTRLQKYLGITARSIFELSHLFKLVKYCQTSPKLINKRAVNLSEQVEHHFGLPLEKDNDVRCSDWTRSLNYRQVQCEYLFSFQIEGKEANT
ncbi:hypothetical protein ASPWEDRAFT_431801 [Aspergillus wentii DTO 134E9]|uniref:3'-5' exonuclease domain-containing protein n=1 Tax=Aspergillus wentii DTO 134E9 TaxID=1073089 RepID=A0A1L9RPR8_ASPWE|nr:uncharacterized protein ASPWEDRAFT_431801 [Aspergillus wentii DTO 134E9]OJJ36853.1 hypothetical protein ASPWEDRAFT_431801 [Aspergillus wentii DTO 134E9]